jgi:hypothetical protein
LKVTSYFSSDALGENVITSANEGTTVYFNIKTVNDIEVDALLYTRRASNSTTNTNDFNGAIQDYVSLLGSHASFPISIKEDELTEGGERLVLEVALNTSFGQILTQSGLNINDTSLNRNPT